MKNIRQILYKISNNTAVIEANLDNEKIGISELIAIIENRWSLTIKNKIKLLEELYPHGNVDEKKKIKRVINYYDGALKYCIPRGYSCILKLEKDKSHIFTDMNEAVRKAVHYKKEHDDKTDFDINIIRNNAICNNHICFGYDYKGNMNKIHSSKISDYLDNILNIYIDIKNPYKHDETVRINDSYYTNIYGNIYDIGLYIIGSSKEEKKELDLDYFDSTVTVVFYNNDHDHIDLFDIYRKE